MKTVEFAVRRVIEQSTYDRHAPRVSLGRLAWSAKAASVVRRLRSGQRLDAGSALLADAIAVTDAAKPHPRRYPWGAEQAARAEIASVTTDLQIIDLITTEEYTCRP